jgi:hypothetical protein
MQKRGELEASTVDAVRKALSSPAAAGGDVLVFLPGVAEIRRTQRLLEQESFIRNAGVQVQQLHGGLAPQQQDEVIRCVCPELGWTLPSIQKWLLTGKSKTAKALELTVLLAQHDRQPISPAGLLYGTDHCRCCDISMQAAGPKPATAGGARHAYRRELHHH